MSDDVKRRVREAIAQAPKIVTSSGTTEPALIEADDAHTLLAALDAATKRAEDAEERESLFGLGLDSANAHSEELRASLTAALKRAEEAEAKAAKWERECLETRGHRYAALASVERLTRERDEAVATSSYAFDQANQNYLRLEAALQERDALTASLERLREAGDAMRDAARDRDDCATHHCRAVLSPKTRGCSCGHVELKAAADFWDLATTEPVR